MEVDAGGGVWTIPEPQSASEKKKCIRIERDRRRALVSELVDYDKSLELRRQQFWSYQQSPELQKIYHVAPVGLAFLSPDCRYLEINQRMTEICGISVEDHLGRSVRDCVPALADAVEGIVGSIMETGEPVTGIEVAGQRADQAEERSWVTYWHPL